MTLTLEKGTILEKAAFQGEKASRAVAEGLIYLKKTWDISDEEISSYLHIPRTTISNWIRSVHVPVQKPGAFTPDTEAVLHLLSVHRSLFAMFSSPERQKEWLATEHPVLKERPADMMRRSVEGLSHVRRYLDYARGRGA